MKYAIFLCFAFPIEIFSQQFEIQLSVGYGYSAGGSAFTDYTKISDSRSGNSLTTNLKDVKDKYVSLGQGTRCEAKIIYYFIENIGAYFQPGYSFGSESATTTLQEYGQNWSLLTTDKKTIEFNSYYFQSGLQFKFPKWIIQPYGGIGGSYYVQNKLNTTEEYNSNVDYLVEQELKVYNPFGFSGFFGINIPWSPNVSFFAEVKGNLVTYYSKQSEIKKYMIDGQNRLESLKTRDKIVIYEADKNYSTTMPADENQPRNGGAPVATPGSNVSFNGGISFVF